MIIEKQYLNSTWCASIRDGICKEAAKHSIKIKLCEKQSLHALPCGSIVVLLGVSYSFAADFSRLCLQNKLRPFIAGFEFLHTDMQVSHITIDRRSSMSYMVNSLVSCGAKHIALLGINSLVSTDIEKLRGYTDAALAHGVSNPGEDVYYSDNDLSSCMEAFWKKHDKYDAVACANDFYAAHLCYEASLRNIRIPEDLMVTGFGNARISQFTSPSLTTVALDLSALGAQVIALCRLLYRNPDLLSCNATFKSEIIYRGSTRIPSEPLPEPIAAVLSPSELEPTFESQLHSIYALENILTVADDTNINLIQGLLSNESYSTLSEKLFLSDTAFKHRLYKLFSATNCKTRKELTALFLKYIPQYKVN